jgi:hypothetical protein
MFNGSDTKSSCKILSSWKEEEKQQQQEEEVKEKQSGNGA